MINPRSQSRSSSCKLTSSIRRIAVEKNVSKMLRSRMPVFVVMSIEWITPSTSARAKYAAGNRCSSLGSLILTDASIVIQSCSNSHPHQCLTAARYDACVAKRIGLSVRRFGLIYSLDCTLGLFLPRSHLFARLRYCHMSNHGKITADVDDGLKSIAMN